MTIRNSVASAVSLLVGCGTAAFSFVGTASADDFFLKPGSLVISSSTYENTKGAVAGLSLSTTLPGTGPTITNGAVTTPGATVAAVSDGNYVTVWSNEVPDASFGVTSPIFLTDVDENNGRELGRLAVPADQVVTSFSSKSELGLHYHRDERGGHLVFVGYGGANVGALDVSNSDAVPGQDPTNPVTFAFGDSYAFPRTIVSLDDFGHFSYTPTENYGGNNGRAALLGPNGLYYTVGNANNGNADAFGSATNGTTPDVTETTGLEVVQPINGWSATALIKAQKLATSAEVNPLLQYEVLKSKSKTKNGVTTTTTALALDKPGKDNNFRGITEYQGALYFTKGSGSNGVQTVYTIIAGAQVPSGFTPDTSTNPTGPADPDLPASKGNLLPTIAQAAGQANTTAAIQILNGFPVRAASEDVDPSTNSTDTTSGGDFTPFGLFFANDHTLYVADEGTGSSTDVASHAGLEKWVLNTTTQTWSLAYTLQNGLIGKSYGPVVGPRSGDMPWPAVTNVGLRNLAGRVNKDGTVTLWAVTSTTDTNAANTDVGADPNEVVEITDSLGATTATTAVSKETFRVVAPPVYGNVYRGVAYVPADDDHDFGHGFGDGHDHH